MTPASNPWLARRVIGWAHQGGAGEGPPGTIATMRAALEHGAAGLEFDLHLSRDRQLVVHHDAVLEVGDARLTIAETGSRGSACGRPRPRDPR